MAALPEEHVRDNRLLLQLGVLAAFLYLVCLAGWFLRHNAQAEEGMSTRTRPMTASMSARLSGSPRMRALRMPASG